MQKEFVSHQQALELKELGFNERCFGWYCNGKLTTNFDDLYHKVRGDSYEMVKAPLCQQAFRFFRKKLVVKIISIGGDDYKKYSYLLYLNDYTQVSGEGGNTYEEAELACLNKLIEITKNK
jgi:hypothetical protein